MKKKLKSKKRRFKNPVNHGLIDFMDAYDDEKIEKCRDGALTLFKESQQWRSPFRDKWLRYYQMYRSYSPYYADAPDWQSSYFIPKSFEVVETVTPRWIGAMYDAPPLWTTIPFHPDGRELGKKVESFLDYRVHQTNMVLSHMEIAKEMFIYGSSIPKIYHESTPEFEGSKLMATDLFDIFPDPMAKNIETARFVIHREIKHISYIRDMEEQGLFKNTADIETGGGSKTMSALDRQRYVPNDGGLSSGDLEKDYHECLEIWADYYDEDTEEHFHTVMVVVDRDTVVRFEESPYVVQGSKDDLWYAVKPFLLFRDHVTPHEFYGIGELEVMEYLQYEINDRRNAIGDALQFALSPVFQVLTGAVKDLDDVNFMPGEIIETRMLNALAPLEPNLGFMHGYTDVDKLENDIQAALGIYDTIKGKAGERRQTATETITLQMESNERFKFKNQHNEIGPMARQAKIMTLMEAQYSTKKVNALVMDSGSVQGFVQIDPKELRDFEGKYECANLYGNKAITAQQRLQLLEVLRGFPPEILQRVDWETMFKLIADSMNMKDEKILLPAEAPSQVPAPEPPQQQAPQMPMGPEGMMPGMVGPGGAPPVPVNSLALSPADLAMQAAGGGPAEALAAENPMDEVGLRMAVAQLAARQRQLRAV